MDPAVEPMLIGVGRSRPPDRALDTVSVPICLTLRYMYPIRQKSNTCSVGVELKGQRAGWRPPRSLPSSPLRTSTPAAPGRARLRVRVVSIAVALRRDRSKRPEFFFGHPAELNHSCGADQHSGGRPSRSGRPRDRLLANTVRGNFRFSPVSGTQDRLEGAATVRGGSDATR
jgi:hypothetical protein